jgi:hypothetical protein
MEGDCKSVLPTFQYSKALKKRHGDKFVTSFAVGSKVEQVVEDKPIGFFCKILGFNPPGTGDEDVTLGEDIPTYTMISTEKDEESFEEPCEDVHDVMSWRLVK